MTYILSLRPDFDRTKPSLHFIGCDDLDVVFHRFWFGLIFDLEVQTAISLQTGRTRVLHNIQLLILETQWLFRLGEVLGVFF